MNSCNHFIPIKLINKDEEWKKILIRRGEKEKKTKRMKKKRKKSFLQ